MGSLKLCKVWFYFVFTTGIDIELRSSFLIISLLIFYKTVLS